MRMLVRTLKKLHFMKKYQNKSTISTPLQQTFAPLQAILAPQKVLHQF
jgi:hypothetical protein